MIVELFAVNRWIFERTSHEVILRAPSGACFALPVDVWARAVFKLVSLAELRRLSPYESRVEMSMTPRSDEEQRVWDEMLASRQRTSQERTIIPEQCERPGCTSDIETHCPLCDQFLCAVHDELTDEEVVAGIPFRWHPRGGDGVKRKDRKGGPKR